MASNYVIVSIKLHIDVGNGECIILFWRYIGKMKWLVFVCVIRQMVTTEIRE